MTAERLADLLPGFAAHWSKGDSLFLADDGSFTVHGVFAECSHFVRENYRTLPAAATAGLSSFVSDCLEGRYGPEADNAAATCFLENLAGEPFHQAFAEQLRPAAKKFYDSARAA